MAETTEEQLPDKLILFNNSRNPYHLKDGPPYVDKKIGTETIKVGMTRRFFEVGTSIECLDAEEYNLLRSFKGISTTKQAIPGVQNYIDSLTAEIATHKETIADLRGQLEKSCKKGK